MKRSHDLLVFDWDGTLMDSIATIVACARASHLDLDQEPPPDERVRALVGLRLDLIARDLLPGADAALHVAWIERYRHHWIHTFHEHLELLAGARETIETLTDSGYLLAVATGKSRRGLDRDLEATGLGPRFLASRTVDESPSKPSPGMLLELMDELGVRPERTLMIGDTSHDAEMARNAGVAAVGVLTGSHDRATLEDCGVVTCLDRVADLPSWLAR